MIPSHITVAAIAALIAALATWFFQDNRYTAELAELRLEHANAVIKATSTLRAEQHAITTKYQGALNAATERETKLRADADTARRTADGLRGTIYEFRASLPGASTAALITRADTAAELFGACVNEYRSVAESADRHAADAVMLIEAWPSNVGR
jgi:hypothetical protein